MVESRVAEGEELRNPVELVSGVVSVEAPFYSGLGAAQHIEVVQGLNNQNKGERNPGGLGEMVGTWMTWHMHPS